MCITVWEVDLWNGLNKELKRSMFIEHFKKMYRQNIFGLSAEGGIAWWVGILAPGIIWALNMVEIGIMYLIPVVSNLGFVYFLH